MDRHYATGNGLHHIIRLVFCPEALFRHLSIYRAALWHDCLAVYVARSEVERQLPVSTCVQSTYNSIAHNHGYSRLADQFACRSLSSLLRDFNDGDRPRSAKGTAGLLPDGELDVIKLLHVYAV